MKILYHPDRKDIQLASVLYALSDPLRLYVVSEIRKHGEQACNSFNVPIAKSTMSHHARTLREAESSTPVPREHSACCRYAPMTWKSGSPAFLILYWRPMNRLVSQSCCLWRRRKSTRRQAFGFFCTTNEKEDVIARPFAVSIEGKRTPPSAGSSSYYAD